MKRAKTLQMETDTMRGEEGGRRKSWPGGDEKSQGPCRTEGIVMMRGEG